jgi:hypothetical protein
MLPPMPRGRCDRWLLACVATAAACRGGPGASGASARIEASCTLVRDGATCELDNRGAGAGARCVRVLVGVRAKGSVYESGEVCSGWLAPRGTITVAVRFPQRPAALCGAGAPGEGCAVHVADVGDAAAAAAWQKQLRGAGTDAPQGGDCASLAEHVFALRVTEEVDLAATEEEKRAARLYMEEEKPYILEEWTHSCAEMTPRVAACVRGAQRYGDVDRCWDLIDER